MPESVPTSLDHEVARVAGRLVGLLRASFPDPDTAVADATEFLDAEADAPAAPDADPGPLGRLEAALGLSRLEAGLLVLVALPEAHEGFATVFRLVHPRGEPYPTAGLAAKLFADAGRAAVRGALEAGALVESGAVRPTGDAPFFERSLRPAEALWPALAGGDAWPAAVRPLTVSAPAAGLVEWLTAPATFRVAAALTAGTACTVLLSADSDEAAFRRGLALVRAAKAEPVGLLAPASADGEWDRLVALHAAARGLVPVVKVNEGTPPLLDRFPGPVVLCGHGAAGAGRPVLALAAGRLSVAGRRAAWAAALPGLDAEELAGRFPVEPFAAEEAAADATLAAELAGRAATADDVAAALRARGSAVLAAGADLVRPRAGFDQLVLPAAARARLRELVGRVALRGRVLDAWDLVADRPGGRGVRALFAGPPGTGKTLAAEAVARELGADLLVVDLARVVSKWVGETEKNLAAAFDAAERGRAVLFFDEADALFGKRTAVADAHDRYANLETAFLLARLEKFDGLTVLATNLRDNLDPAFARRFESVVEFADPGRDERLALWRLYRPPGAAGVDFAPLADLYAASGAVIRGAAVAAAFLAAADRTPVTAAHLTHALRREYEKAGRAFPGPAEV